MRQLVSILLLFCSGCWYPTKINYYVADPQIVTAEEAYQAIDDWFWSRGQLAGFAMQGSDNTYALYDGADIRQCLLRLPPMYAHPGLPQEWWDCDDFARHIMYWSRAIMPGVCCFSVYGLNGGSGHEFVGFLTRDKDIMFMNAQQDPMDYDLITDIRYSEM